MGGSFKKQRNFSDRRKSGIMLEMGDAKSTSLAESQCGKAFNSADYKIYF